MYNSLEIREIFHIEFLRRLYKSINNSNAVLKGGTNLRLFFKSIRYSEDMDMDINDMPVHVFKDKIMQILDSKTFKISLKFFGITDIVSPDISKAKQTETVQRFKVHLLTDAGEDLFTKLEFSRRGFDKYSKSEAVNPEILNKYKLSPLIVRHYSAVSAFNQKINALLNRKVPQARDIFDLFVLSTQIEPESANGEKIKRNDIEALSQRIYEISFDIFMDTVVSFMELEERNIYGSKDVWDEIRLSVLRMIEGGTKKNV